MENKNTAPSEMTMLQLLEVLSERSDDSRLGEEFWSANSGFAEELATRLSVTPTQAVLLAICLRRGPRCVEFSDIAGHLDISNIREVLDTNGLGCKQCSTENL